MTTFTIENETNNATAHATLQEAEAIPNAGCFDSEEGLSNLAVAWPTARLTEIWNGLPGATSVTKFKDRKTAISRVWKAVQPLAESLPSLVQPEPANEPVATNVAAEEVATGPLVVETEPDACAQKPTVAPESAKPTNKTTRATKASTGEPRAPRAESKASQVIAMLRREGGTTLDEIMDATIQNGPHGPRGYHHGP